MQVCNEYVTPSTTYRRLTHPQPAPKHMKYPFFTPGGGDLRWLDSAAFDKRGLYWVGGMMFVTNRLLHCLVYHLTDSCFQDCSPTPWPAV